MLITRVEGKTDLEKSTQAITLLRVALLFVFLPKPTKGLSSVVVPCLACMQEPRVSPHILEDEECGRALTSMERVRAKFQCHRNMFNGAS